VIRKDIPKLKGRWSPTELEWQCFFELRQYHHKDLAEEYARKHKHNIKKTHDFYDGHEDDDVEELVRRRFFTFGTAKLWSRSRLKSYRQRR
jgi:hypothetical protein